MVDFISEVQEELRKDDYNRWLKKYGPYLLGVIVAIILATAFHEWRKDHAQKMAAATSATYLAAGQKAADGDVKQAIAEYEAIADVAPSGYAGLSLMRAAQLEMDQGNPDKAILLFDQASAEFEMPRHQQLAQIKAAYLQADRGNYDDVMVRTALLTEKGQPYEYLARELMGIAALQKGDTSLAKQQFSYLDSIPGVPESIKSRASQYLSMMSVSEDSAQGEEVAASEETSAPDAGPSEKPLSEAEKNENE